MEGVRRGGKSVLRCVGGEGRGLGGRVRKCV